MKWVYYSFLSRGTDKLSHLLRSHRELSLNNLVVSFKTFQFFHISQSLYEFELASPSPCVWCFFHLSWIWSPSFRDTIPSQLSRDSTIFLPLGEGAGRITFFTASSTSLWEVHNLPSVCIWMPLSAFSCPNLTASACGWPGLCSSGKILASFALPLYLSVIATTKCDNSSSSFSLEVASWHFVITQNTPVIVILDIKYLLLECHLLEFDILLLSHPELSSLCQWSCLVIRSCVTWFWLHLSYESIKDLKLPLLSWIPWVVLSTKALYVPTFLFPLHLLCFLFYSLLSWFSSNTIRIQMADWPYLFHYASWWLLPTTYPYR